MDWRDEKVLYTSSLAATLMVLYGNCFELIMKIFVVCLLVAGTAAQVDLEFPKLWTNYKAAFNKSFKGKDESTRRKIFEQNLAIIIKHNIEADMGLHSYKRGVNEFCPMSTEEFVDTYNGYNKNMSLGSSGCAFNSSTNVTIPDTVEWKTKGYVTPVKNQGRCGSCWAFSAIGSLEGQHFKKTGQLVSLSPQNLVDCSRVNWGCQGGWMDAAFQHIKESNGINTEASYPYTAKQDSCKFKRNEIGARVTGHVDIPTRDEEALKKAVATIGPIAVAIDASHSSFHFYKSGIYDERKCSASVLDHAVLAVGYGTENGQDYWLIKNSWGTSWGTDGYGKMSRNKNNQCGIATEASYPLV